MSKRSEKIIHMLIPAGLVLMCVVMALLGGKVINLEKRLRGYEAVEQLGERESRLVQLSWIEENAYEASDISTFSTSLRLTM